MAPLCFVETRTHRFITHNVQHFNIFFLMLSLIYNFYVTRTGVMFQSSQHLRVTGTIVLLLWTDFFFLHCLVDTLSLTLSWQLSLLIDRMRQWSIVGSVGPFHGPGRQRLHASRTVPRVRTSLGRQRAILGRAACPGGRSVVQSNRREQRAGRFLSCSGETRERSVRS